MRRYRHRHRIGASGETELARIELHAAGGVAHDDGATGHVDVKAVGRRCATRGGDAAAIVLAQQRAEMGAANTDGGGLGLEADLFPVALADQAGDRAQATLEHAEDDVVTLRLAGFVGVVLDLEPGAGAHHHFAAVGELDPGIGFGLGGDRVAFGDVRLDREQLARTVRALGRQGAGQVRDLAGGGCQSSRGAEHAGRDHPQRRAGEPHSARRSTRRTGRLFSVLAFHLSFHPWIDLTSCPCPSCPCRPCPIPRRTSPCRLRWSGRSAASSGQQPERRPRLAAGLPAICTGTG